MSPLIVGLLLPSAIVHASWNALVRNSEDRLWAIAVIAVAGAMVALPIAIALGVPAKPSLAYIAASAGLQVGYSLFLARAYQHGHLAHVYPVARGSAPLLVTLGAALFARELPGPYGLVGNALVSSGIGVLVVGRHRPGLPSVLSALAAGAFIASYMVVDGLGVRLAGKPAAYAAWQAVAGGLLIPFAYVATSRRLPALPRGRQGLLTVAAGVLGTFGYCIAVWAMSRAPMGSVSAVRETSILFAAIIGAVVLRERFTANKIVGACLVTAGVICLSGH